MTEIDKILEDRQSEYGDALRNFERIGKMCGIMLGIDAIPAWQVALMMDAVKTVRVLANPNHSDSWLDKMGYVRHGINIIAGTNKVS